MNMRFTIPEMLAADEIGPDFLRHAPPKPAFDRDRAVGLGITIALHVVIIAALIYGGVRAAQVITPKVVTVTLQETKVETPPPLLPPPLLIQPQVETIAPPDVLIATDTPPPITTQTVDKPVVRTDPPHPVAAETQASYLARVLAQMNRYKRYPADARRAHIQGVVMLHFVMDKDGKVTAFDVAQSSGRPALDTEALALIQRAQPLPPIPANFGRDTLNAVVPIEFSLH